MWTCLNQVIRAHSSSRYIGVFSRFISLRLSLASKILVELLRILEIVFILTSFLLCLLLKSIAIICWVQWEIDRWICTSSFFSPRVKYVLFLFPSSSILKVTTIYHNEFMKLQFGHYPLNYWNSVDIHWNQMRLQPNEAQWKRFSNNIQNKVIGLELTSQIAKPNGCLEMNVWNLDNLQIHISLPIQTRICQDHHQKKYNQNIFPTMCKT